MENQKRIYLAEYVKRRYIKLKLDAIQYKGGKCVCCGYDKCPATMSFHHRDPQQKDMAWNHLRKRSWEYIKQELDKCDLLCSNCHAEYHYDKKISEEAIKWLQKKKQARLAITKVKGTIGICLICGREFVRKKWDKDKKYCSGSCVAKSQERIAWPTYEDLVKMIKEKGIVQVGLILGVSTQAIKKHIGGIVQRQR